MRRLVLTAALLGCLVVPTAREAHAEIKSAGSYVGTYRVDRWRQHRFSFLYVDPDLADRMRAYASGPHLLECTQVDQPTNPGGAMIRAVGDATPLAKPLDVDVAWRAPTRADSVLRVADGSGVTLAIGLRRGDVPRHLDLSRTRMHVWVEARVPPAPRDGALGAWNNAETFGPLHSELPVQSIARSLFRTGVESGVVGPAGPPLGAPDERLTKDDARLAAGRTHTFDATLRGLPPGEYEVGFVYHYTGRVGERAGQSIAVTTTGLRLDVLADEPTSHHGLRATLRQPRDTARDPGRRRLEVLLTNESEDTLAFHLPGPAGATDLTESLSCYDVDGTLVRSTSGPERLDASLVRLTAGESLIVPARTPPGTTLVRLAFLHRWMLNEAPAGTRQLPYGRLLSQHLNLTDR